MGSPRYLAEHLLMPRFVREQGALAVLDAIENANADFFIPVWMEAGFRFNTRLMYSTRDDQRVGVLTLPMPRDATEAYLALILGRKSDSSYLRYFLWERGDSPPDEEPHTVIGEWKRSQHLNYGAGPPFTGNLANDCEKFIARVVLLDAGARPAAPDTDQKK